MCIASNGEISEMPCVRNGKYIYSTALTLCCIRKYIKNTYFICCVEIYFPSLYYCMTFSLRFGLQRLTIIYPPLVSVSKLCVPVKQKYNKIIFFKYFIIFPRPISDQLLFNSCYIYLETASGLNDHLHLKGSEILEYFMY